MGNFKGFIFSSAIIGLVVYMGVNQYKTNHEIEVHLAENSKINSNNESSNLQSEDYKMDEVSSDADTNNNVVQDKVNFEKTHYLASNNIDSNESESISEEDLSYEIAVNQDKIKKNITKNVTYTKKEIEQIVRNYILENPEIISDAVDRLKDKAEKEASEKRAALIEKLKSDITSSQKTITLGNSDAKNVIVMFFDYNCGFCKKGLETVNSLIKKDDNIKVILRQYPVLGDTSEYLAKMMLAIYLLSPEKYTEVSDSLLSQKINSKMSFEKILIKHNLEIGTITTKANSSDVRKIIDNDVSLGSELRIQGVPAFIINGKFQTGFLSEDVILNQLKDSHN